MGRLAEINGLSADIDRCVLSGDHSTAARQFVEYWNEQGAWDGLREQAQADVIRYMPKACLEFRAVASERTPLAVYRHFRFPVLLSSPPRPTHPPGVISTLQNQCHL
jgi:hypothetical protein